jgi:sugar diacid utilization regulator
LGWHANDDYQIVLVALPPENQKISHYLYNYENVFADSYSDCVALRYDEFIFILLHNGACSLLNQCLPALKKQLTMDDGACSIGNMFCDFTQLKLQYDLAKQPLRIASGQGRVRYYRDFMESHLINALSSCFPLRAICHHAAVRVHEYDLANGTDFLLTLETYLMNNKSLMIASDKLFIHLSTLTYRLKCIEKIAPMQFEDPRERLHILFSCTALRNLSKEESSAVAPSSIPKTTLADIHITERDDGEREL